MQSKKVNVFISYSHKDMALFETFVKYISPLANELNIEILHDRQNKSGDNFQIENNKKIERSDIICFLISSDFLVSKNCLQEINFAKEIQKNKSLIFVPIILSTCLWKSNPNFKKLISIPTDSKPIDTFENINEAWFDVCKNLESLFLHEKKIKSLNIKEEFLNALDSSGVFEKSHPVQETLKLSDIYVFPELCIYDIEKGQDKYINSNEIFHNSPSDKVLLIGEDQSGKTSLLKNWFFKLLDIGYIPIYIQASKNIINENTVLKCISEQYENFENIEFKNISNGRIAIIIDDFFHISNKKKSIEYVNRFRKSILSINIENNIIHSDLFLKYEYTAYVIQSFKPSLRNELIKKWTDLEVKDKRNPSYYQGIDSKTQNLNSFLGNSVGKGIIPSTPFFILSLLNTSYTLTKPLELEITSQGFCYQQLIQDSLKKQKINNTEIDFYINFLSELSYFVFKLKTDELSADEFRSFCSFYEDKFVKLNDTKFIENIINSGILTKSGLSYYSFTYKYIYYFFCGKYFSDNISKNEVRDELENILKSMHITENAYIAIFVSHHSKHESILEEIQLTTMLFHDEFTPATLNKDEIGFFGTKIDLLDNIISLTNALPDTTSPEEERKINLERQDSITKLSKNDEVEETEDKEDKFFLEFRRSFKTVEVIGHIIKNRSGSLEKSVLSEAFTESVDTLLRFLSFHINIINNSKNENEIIETLTHILLKVQQDENIINDERAVRDKATKMFWQINFYTIFLVIGQVVKMLCSEKLSEIIRENCLRKNTAATKLIYFISSMWNEKKINIDELKLFLKDKNTTYVTHAILRIHLINYAKTHYITPGDRSKLSALFENKVQIPIFSNKL